MRRRFSLGVFLGILVLPATLVFATEYSSTNFKIESPEINGGSEEGSSATFQLESSNPFIEPRTITSTSFQILPGGDDATSTPGSSFVAPVATAASGPDYSQVRVTWTAATGVSSPTYEVGVSSQQGGPYVYSSDTVGNSAILGNLSFAQRYYFVVRTLDGATPQALSNEVSVFPQSYVTATGSSASGGGSAPAPLPPVYAEPILPTIVFPRTDSGLTTPGSSSSQKHQKGGISGILGNIVDKITDFFSPEKPYVVGKIALESVVPRFAPSSLKGHWSLIPKEPVREFVFRPLPKELRNLAASLPQLGKIFSDVGINRFNDLDKLKNISLKIPGLGDALALPTVKVLGGAIQTPKQVRIAELTPDLKAKFPQDVLFTKFAGGLVDAKPTLRLTNKGQTEQVVRTISGSKLNLSIKPGKKVKSVTGYLVFKSKATPPAKKPGAFSPFGVSVARAATKELETTETMLVVDAFEFVDENTDGIYTSEFNSPVTSGEYEVLTVITYEDDSKGTQVVQMVTVVDPEGYIFESKEGKEVRVPGAIVSLDWLNSETNTYERWPANQYGQENPQITDVTGQYAFLVPPGLYRLKVEAPGYSTYEGKPFPVNEGRGVHENLELRSKFSFLEFLDWKTAMLIVVFLLIIYNFYKDKIRERRALVEPGKPPSST